MSSINIYCKRTYFKRRVERNFLSKMKRKSRDWELTLELSCHAGCPTAAVGKPRTDSRGAPGARSPKIGKNMIFWRKIVIFHTKYPKNFRASFRKWKKIWFFCVKSWFFTRNTPKFFAPPSARRNFFKCAPPPNFKSWIRPWSWCLFWKLYQGGLWESDPVCFVGVLVLSQVELEHGCSVHPWNQYADWEQ